MPPSPSPAARVLDLTRALIERFGPRLAGSPACRQAAGALQAELQRICGRAALEPFTTRPGAFMGFYKINVPIYILCALLLALHAPWPAALGLLFITLTGFAEFGYYKEFFDPLFPKKECANLLARLEPQGPATRQLLISGHHDSAQELTFLLRWQKLYALRIVLADVFVFTALLGAWLWALQGSASLPPFAAPLAGFSVLGIALMLPKFFLVTPRGVPGAGDNLVASAMLVELARQFADPHRPGTSRLQHTRLLLVSFDAEESGLRGSRAFAARHRAELQALPSYMLNIDSIYHTRELQFVTRDLNGTVPLSEDLARRAARRCAAAGGPQRFYRMAFGGGGTDAAELAKVGVQATTLIGLSTALVRDGLVYHTLNDTVDAIEPAAVRICLETAAGLAEELDGWVPQ
jgi:aminopeptidase YwaD